MARDRYEVYPFYTERGTNFQIKDTTTFDVIGRTLTSREDADQLCHQLNQAFDMGWIAAKLEAQVKQLISG